MIKKIFPIVLLLLISISFVLSQPVGILINMKDNFSYGKAITYNYTIDLPFNSNIQYFNGISCTGLPDSPIILKNAQYNGSEIEGNFVGPTVDKTYSNCYAFVSIVSPNQIYANKTFSTLGSYSLNLNPLICKDSSCLFISKVFSLGDPIYLNYSSSVQNLNTKSTITYPDGTIKNIALPSSIEANEIGTYTLYINASKEGYSNLEKEIQFAVINGNSESFLVNQSNSLFGVKGIPQENANTSSTNDAWIYFVIVGVLILLLIYVILKILDNHNFSFNFLKKNCC
jgi:hypothetical protein